MLVVDVGNPTGSWWGSGSVPAGYSLVTFTLVVRQDPALDLGVVVLSNVILILNGKGGVGKTSLAANLAGIAALSGWRALVVDLDRQGNLLRDLGYQDRTDWGAGMLDSVMGGVPLRPLRDVRDRLDVVPGGMKSEELSAFFQMSVMNGRTTALHNLEAALMPVAGDYDVVLLDTGPSGSLVHSAALLAAHYVLIPTKTDDASLDGLGTVTPVIVEQRRYNPHLELLGVSIMFAPASGSQIVSRARRKLAEIVGEELVFATTVRHAAAVADDCREQGLLAYEYELRAKEDSKKWWEALKEGRKAKRYSSAAPSLATDYANLAQEVFTRYAERQTAMAQV